MIKFFIKKGEKVRLTKENINKICSFFNLKSNKDYIIVEANDLYDYDTKDSFLACIERGAQFNDIYLIDEDICADNIKRTLYYKIEPKKVNIFLFKNFKDFVDMKMDAMRSNVDFEVGMYTPILDAVLLYNKIQEQENKLKKENN